MLNPLLLAVVYFILVDIVAPGSRGATSSPTWSPGSSPTTSSRARCGQAVESVSGGGRLILNTAFPRVLLPLSSVFTAFMRFLPTVIVYIPIHVVAGLPFT